MKIKRIAGRSQTNQQYKILYSTTMYFIYKRYSLNFIEMQNLIDGGKGVVSKILPDQSMPLMIDKNTGEKKVVEVVMNPYSTINRR